MKITFSKIAKSDLKAIVEYIKRDSAKYAFLEKRKIENAIDKLIKQPWVGKVFSEDDNENLRELIFRNYRIIYEIISASQINILTIHHHSRLISNNPAFKDDDE